jgi:hypothetical protein
MAPTIRSFGAWLSVCLAMSLAILASSYVILPEGLAGRISGPPIAVTKSR